MAESLPMLSISWKKAEIIFEPLRLFLCEFRTAWELNHCQSLRCGIYTFFGRRVAP